MKKHIATAPLYIGRARALNAGDVVPTEHLERYGPARSDEHPDGLGWNELVEEVDVDDDQAGIVSFNPAAAAIKAVESYVGSDPVKAAEALEAELAKPEADQRKTLIESLRKIADA